LFFNECISFFQIDEHLCTELNLTRVLQLTMLLAYQTVHNFEGNGIRDGKRTIRENFNFCMTE